MPSEKWRYRLELLPLPRPEGPEPERRPLASRGEAGWELVSRKIADDGLTEQRVYRRPA